MRAKVILAVLPVVAGMACLFLVSGRADAG
jgi:hypothetical protein